MSTESLLPKKPSPPSTYVLNSISSTKERENIHTKWLEDLEEDILVEESSGNWCIPLFEKEIMSSEERGIRKVVVNFPEKCVQNNNEIIQCGNYIKTSKYTIFNFLPLNLFEQFMRAANFYFLLMVVIVCIPEVSSIEPYTSIMPLAFVLSVSAIKEAVEDHNRYVSDTKINARISHLVCDPKTLFDQTVVQRSRSSWYTPIVDFFSTVPNYFGERLLIPVSNITDSNDNKGKRRASLSVVSKKYLFRVAWEDIRVGDVLRIDEGQEFPVDLVLLSSSESDGTCKIVTANLDGETNLKTINAVPDTASYTNAINLFSGIAEKAYVECELPNSNMHNFEGVYYSDKNSVGTPLTKDNILLRGASLKNTSFIYGLCVYAGHETKLFLNSNEPAIKRTTVDEIVNYLMYTIFAMLFTVCIISGVGSGVWEAVNTVNTYSYLRYSPDNIAYSSLINGTLNFLGYSVLYSLMVPISLYVSIEMVKVFQAYIITCDLQMYHAESNTKANARTSNLNEELGQIEYVFCDKTGTLTQNQMAFYQCSLNGIKYGEPDISTSIEADAVKTLDFMFYDPKFSASFAQGDLVVEEFLLCLALCHGCIPSLSDNDSVEKYKYASSSPDEVSLVGAAANLGVVFARRDGKFAILEFPKESRLQNYAKSLNSESSGVPTLSYEILDIIEFTSERRRMSVVVRCPDGSIKLYSKGADSSILPRLVNTLSEEVISRTKAHLEEYSVQGLRTLCIANRVLDISEYDAWGARFLAASREIGDRKIKMQLVAEKIEYEFNLLGATAIEDKLQDGVPQCISKLRLAGIKVWVLTGDKRETAINIGKSCSLIDSSLNLFTIEGSTAGQVANCLREIMSKLPAPDLSVVDQVERFNRSSKDINLIDSPTTTKHGFSKMQLSDWNYKGIALVADGQALHYVFTKPTCRDLFLELIQHSEFKVCICARMAPKQKATIVQLVKDNLDAVTLAIGDGANDVPMIQAAHVGIGISGKEGRQAVNSSDYSIAQFRYLSRLLFVHGRYSYKRTTKLILYSFFKNMVISYTQLWFACYSGFSGMEFYDGLLLNTFNVFFTSWPILFVAAFDRECSTEEHHAYPELYESGRRREGFGFRVFWQWCITGFIDSFVVFFIPLYALSTTTFTNDLPSFSVAVYTIVIIVINIKIFNFASSWTWPNLVASLLSVFIYFAFIFTYCSMVDYSAYIFNVPNMLFAEPTFWLSLMLCVVITFLPNYVLMYYTRTNNIKFKQIIRERRLIFKENPDQYVEYATAEWNTKLNQYPQLENKFY